MPHEVMMHPLPVEVTTSEIAHFFASCGAIESIRRMPERGTEGWVVVSFMTQAGQEHALAMNGWMLQGQILTLQRMPDKVAIERTSET